MNLTPLSLKLLPNFRSKPDVAVQKNSSIEEQNKCAVKQGMQSLQRAPMASLNALSFAPTIPPRGPPRIDGVICFAGTDMACATPPSAPGGRAASTDPMPLDDPISVTPRKPETGTYPAQTGH